MFVAAARFAMLNIQEGLLHLRGWMRLAGS